MCDFQDLPFATSVVMGNLFASCLKGSSDDPGQTVDLVSQRD